MILLPRKRGKKLAKKSKSEISKADLEDFGNNYGIDHLKIGEAKHDSDYSKLLLAQRKIGHMENKINNDKSLTNECNVLSNPLGTIKRAKQSHYSPILQGCMNT